MVSFIEKLRQARAERTARDAEPWRLPLERVHGKIGDDGVERITTQLLFDILEVPQRSRGAGACRRLGEADGRARVDGCAGPRAHARRLFGASARVLPPTAPRCLTSKARPPSVDFVVPINSAR